MNLHLALGREQASLLLQGWAKLCAATKPRKGHGPEGLTGVAHLIHGSLIIPILQTRKSSTEKLSLLPMSHSLRARQRPAWNLGGLALHHSVGASRQPDAKTAPRIPAAGTRAMLARPSLG